MRINFSTDTLLSKNAKRIIEIVNQLEITDQKFNKAIKNLSLTKVKDALASAYGYTNSTDLKAHLSKDEPQLDNLDNTQRLDLELRMVKTLGAYFRALKIPSNIAHSVASGVQPYLDSKVNGVKKVKRDKAYDTYKNIAGSYGVTIPALKKNLESVGSLKGIFPTKKAILNGWCRVSIMISEAYGIKPKILWCPKYVAKVQKRRGVAVKSKYQKYERPTGLMNADNKMASLGDALLDIILANGGCECDLDNNEMCDWCWDNAHLHFEIHCHYLAANSAESIRFNLNELFKRLLPKAHEIDPKETELIENSLNKLIEWVASR